ncbi:MAG: metal-sensitive transcriptional regulator [Chloroflexi bacterium]|nr:metal-sensitive transcriptional regulator [Chloroflexota bacterium]
MRDSESEQKVLDRLARIEGQVRGIRKMIEEGRDCEAILTQVLASRTALESAAGEIVGTYINECMVVGDADQARSKISRTVQLLTRVS